MAQAGALLNPIRLPEGHRLALTWLVVLALLLLPCGAAHALDIIFSEGSSVGPVRESGGAPSPPDGPADPTARPEQQTSVPRLSISYNPWFTNTSVGGDGTRSFQPQGFFNRQDLTFDLDHSGPNGMYLTGQFFTRYTDDPQVNAGGQKVTFPGFFVEYGERDAFDIRVGNLPIQFSPYTFSRQGDGVQGRVIFPDKLGAWSFRGVLARLNNSQNGVQFRRFGYGLRFERELRMPDEHPIDNALFGLNAAWSSDDVGSMSDRFGVPEVNSSIYSFDAQMAFRVGLFLDGEYASSSVRTAGSGVTPGRQDGNATRFSVRHTDGPWNVGGAVEKFSPSFQSVTGSGTADLFRTDLFGGYSFGKIARLDLGIQSFHNNLDGQLLQTFKSRFKRVGLTLRPLADSSVKALQPLFFNIGFSTFDAFDSALTNRTTDQWSLAAGYSFGRAAVTYSFQDQSAVDRVNATLNRGNTTHSVQLSYRVPFNKDGSFAMVPSIGATFANSRDTFAGLNSTTDNVVYGLSTELGGEWRLGFAQTVNEGSRPQSVGGLRTTLQVSRRAELAYRARTNSDMQLGIEWNDRNYGDSLPGFSYRNAQLNAFMTSRF